MKLTESEIELGRTYRFKNTLGVVTESTVIAIGNPKKWMLRFRKPNGNEHDITIQGFLQACRLYGIEDGETA